MGACLLDRLKSYPVVPLIVILWITFSSLSPYFFSMGNIEGMLVNNTVLLIAAIGMTFVFLVGGIDLSVSTVISVSAVLAGIVMAKTGDIALGAVTALSVGGLFGAINGLLIGAFGLTPFITTMATQLIARGIAFYLSQGIAVEGTPLALMDFGFVSVKGIPAITLIGLVIALAAALVLGLTTWGRQIILLGSNRSAARYAGLPVQSLEFSAYLLSGLLAGVAGFISIISLGTAIPGVGDTLLLIIIGAVVLGGTSMNGGEGSITRTLLGVALLTVLINGLNLLRIPFYDQLIIQGILIFFGTWLANTFSGKRRDG